MDLCNGLWPLGSRLMINAIGTCVRKYFSFSGRATRREYWRFFLLTGLVYVLAFLLDVTLRTEGAITLVAAAAIFVPNLAVTARRLHDTDKSGWRQLISIVPVVGLLLLYWLLQPSTDDNHYGPSEDNLRRLEAWRAAEASGRPDA